MKFVYDNENVSVEVFSVCFYQSEDESWNTSLFTDFDEACEYMKKVCKRGFSPELKHCYLEKLVFDDSDF